VKLLTLVIMIKYYAILLPLILFCSHKVTLAQDNFQYQDRTYIETIKTVQLYPAGNPIRQIRYPVMSLRSNQQLMLEFDEVYEDAFSYLVKIIHCNNDWRPSGLSALQYLDDYNEFRVNEMEYSFDTKVPYVHYKFRVPRPKISGNFLLVVYSEGNEDEIILTRRFMVYEQWVQISSAGEIMNRSIQSIDRQNIQFSVKYGDLELLNPMDNVAVTILQNHRWDNAKMQVKPTFIKEMPGILDYNNFAAKDGFLAGNEFRRFDLRSLQYFGFHVETVKLEKKESRAWIDIDYPRAGLSYTIDENKNGQYLIANVERRIAEIENDYATVVFRIKSEKLDGQVHLSGKFTDWQYNERSKMNYDEAFGGYIGNYFLKQGEYDYQYLVQNSADPYTIEGNKSEARNNYEIIVYYRSSQLLADLIIGYRSFTFNGL
jgi:hypothetical protein